MNYRLPTAVVASPPTHHNSAGVILSCTTSLHWDDDPQTVATFHCSFLSHVSMDLALSKSLTTRVAFFDFKPGAKIVDLHIERNVKSERVEVASSLPRKALMVREFGKLVKGVRDCGRSPDEKWPEISRVTQLVLDAVKKSIDLGFLPIS